MLVERRWPAHGQRGSDRDCPPDTGLVRPLWHADGMTDACLPAELALNGSGSRSIDRDQDVGAQRCLSPFSSVALSTGWRSEPRSGPVILSRSRTSQAGLAISQGIHLPPLLLCPRSARSIIQSGGGEMGRIAAGEDSDGQLGGAGTAYG
jgi:hypothetical protein